MKKFSLIISALALVLGLAQCAKRPNMPTLDGVSTSTKTITFTTNGGGDKGEFTQLNKQLNYIWNANDKIHVFATTSETDGFVEGCATYCGAIALTKGAGTTDAIFEGKIELPDGVKKLRFFHYGQSLLTTDGSLTVDYSTQTGSLSDVSDKVVAMCELPANDENIYENCELGVQFAVARIDLSNLTTTANVTMINIKNTGLNVDVYGNITLNKGKEVNIGSANLNDYYLIAMKEVPDTHHTFIAAGETRYANFISAMENNLYYTDNGNAKKIDLLPENSMPSAFSIDGVHKVHFADGNLAYNSKKTPTWFMLPNQWDYIKEWGENIDIDHFYWTNDYFGTAAEYKKGTEGATFDWGNVYCSHQNPSLPDDTWNVLSKDEWEYIIKRENENGVMYALVTINGVYGLVILPDRCDLNPAEINTVQKLKDNHCVFLPASGYREYIGDKVIFSKQGTHGLSWSKNEVNNEWAYSMDFDQGDDPQNPTPRAYIWNETWKYAGCCVRLATKK